VARFSWTNQNSLPRIATNEIASISVDHRLREMAFLVFAKVGKGRLSLKDFEKKSFTCSSLFRYYKKKQMDSMLPCVCSFIDHRRRQNVVRTSETHSTIASCASLLFLPHFDVICDLLLNRRTATWNLFNKLTSVFYASVLLLIMNCALTLSK